VKAASVIKHNGETIKRGATVSKASFSEDEWNQLVEAAAVVDDDVDLGVVHDPDELLAEDVPNEEEKDPEGKIAARKAKAGS
jgi:hypothetical protein